MFDGIQDDIRHETKKMEELKKVEKSGRKWKKWEKVKKVGKSEKSGKKWETVKKVYFWAPWSGLGAHPPGGPEVYRKV